jgi:hypothetical protein
MGLNLLRLSAFVLALFSLAAPWFKAGGVWLPVTGIPPQFLAPYYAGLAVAGVAVTKKERYASLAAACMLSTSPAYAYFALKLTSPATLSPALGVFLCILSASLFAADWLIGLRSATDTEDRIAEAGDELAG